MELDPAVFGVGEIPGVAPAVDVSVDPENRLPIPEVNWPIALSLPVDPSPKMPVESPAPDVERGASSPVPPN
jgi:hypothetical protein